MDFWFVFPQAVLDKERNDGNELTYSMSFKEALVLRHHEFSMEFSFLNAL